jgi:hypothetical protein
MSSASLVDAEPLLRPSPTDLAIAPVLGVLAALDATLATAAYQLLSEHPELALEAMARGDLPSAEARGANLLVFRLCDLRAALRDYSSLALDGQSADDQLNLPF